MPDSMRFRWPDQPGLPGVPVAPKLVAKLPKEIENKQGWTKAEALKDALSDAMSEAWRHARHKFAAVFIQTFREELGEWASWNPDEILLTIRLPIRGLRWIPLKRIRMSDLEKWLDL